MKYLRIQSEWLVW